MFFPSRIPFCIEGFSFKQFFRKILKTEFQWILALIFLCKSCVKLATFLGSGNADFVNSGGFLDFLKLRMIHLKLEICRIDHYFKSCQMDFWYFASKQKFDFLKKIEFLLTFHENSLCKSCVKWYHKTMKSQFFSKVRIFVLKQNIENPSDRTWDNDLFYRSLTSDVPYVASKNLKNLRNSQNQHFPNQEK